MGLRKLFRVGWGVTKITCLRSCCIKKLQFPWIQWRPKILLQYKDSRASHEKTRLVYYIYTKRKRNKEKHSIKYSNCVNTIIICVIKKREKMPLHQLETWLFKLVIKLDPRWLSTVDLCWWMCHIGLEFYLKRWNSLNIFIHPTVYSNLKL